MQKSNNRGFTIVELLIVIVVIAILAAITIVAYNGIQRRATETKRSNDLATIERTLRAYDIQNDGVPRTTTYTNVSSSGGWDYSRNPDWLSFLRETNGNMPVDPENIQGATADPGSAGTRQYKYYCYAQGTEWSPDPSKNVVVIGYIKHDGNAVIRSFEVSRCQ